MYVNTLTISPKGQIVLPKKIRNFLNTNIVTLEVNDSNQGHRQVNGLRA